MHPRLLRCKVATHSLVPLHTGYKLGCYSDTSPQHRALFFYDAKVKVDYSLYKSEYADESEYAAARVTACVRHCGEKGFRLAGLRGRRCHCGNEPPAYHLKVKGPLFTSLPPLLTKSLACK